MFDTAHNNVSWGCLSTSLRQASKRYTVSCEQMMFYKEAAYAGDAAVYPLL